MTKRRYHGLRRTREYVAWNNMIFRCTNEKAPQYNSYGGRGIKVCDRWLSRENGIESFIEDMGTCPPKYSLERIDNDGNYEPNNCRWASQREQMLNRRWLLPKTGFRGLRFNSNGTKYEATASIMGKMYYIGSYDTAEEAIGSREKFIISKERK